MSLWKRDDLTCCCRITKLDHRNIPVRCIWRVWLKGHNFFHRSPIQVEIIWLNSRRSNPQLTWILSWIWLHFEVFTISSDFQWMNFTPTFSPLNFCTKKHEPFFAYTWRFNLRREKKALSVRKQRRTTNQCVQCARVCVSMKWKRKSCLRQPHLLQTFANARKISRLISFYTSNRHCHRLVDM